MPANIAIIGSGQGSYFVPLVHKLHEIDVSVTLVMSNNQHSGLLHKANELNIDSKFISHQGLKRDEFDTKLQVFLTDYNIDFVLLVGFMRILGKKFCRQWQGQVVNVHPSLLPNYQGLMDLEVHRQVLENGDRETGCSVHYVTADVDSGPVIVQKRCTVSNDDTQFTLKKKVQDLEVVALVEAVEKLTRV